MKMTYLLVAGLFLGSMLTATPAHADGKWKNYGHVTVDKKDAVELGVGQKVSKVRITCTDGSIIINTLVVRQAGAKTPHTVGARIDKGEEQMIEIGDEVMVDGFRISYDGRGSFKVDVKK